MGTQVSEHYFLYWASSLNTTGASDVQASLVEYSVIKLPPLPSRVVFREAFEQALLGAAAGATKRRTSRSSSWRVMRACLMFAKDLRFFWN